MPEDRKAHGLFTALSVRINVTIPILRRLTRFGVVRGPAEDKVVERARERLSIVMASADQETQYLSGGNQQKVVLAKWLETDPTVVILDEPTRGVDVGAKFEIYKLMRQLNDRGIAIVMISSELPEVIGMSDRILVMNDGRIVGEVAQEEATEAGIIALATMSDSGSERPMNLAARFTRRIDAHPALVPAAQWADICRLRFHPHFVHNRSDAVRTLHERAQPDECRPPIRVPGHRRPRPDAGYPDGRY